MLASWNTIPMLDRLLDDVMNDVTGTAFGISNRQSHATFEPAIDVRANDDELVFVCDVPGLKEEDLEITLEQGTLTLKGHRARGGSEKDKGWLGRPYGAFVRSFTLPDAVDADHVSAVLADGVLTLRIPKLPRAKPRRISLGSAGQEKQLGEKKE